MKGIGSDLQDQNPTPGYIEDALGYPGADSFYPPSTTRTTLYVV